MTNFFFLAIGSIILFIGAESLVKGAASFARRIGVPSVVIGLTVVSIATSSPELFVSIQASLLGKGDISIGNVIGSNIANIGLIVGITVLIHPIFIHKRLLRIDAGIMLAATVILVIIASIGTISSTIGLLLLLAAFLYMTLSIYFGRDKINLESEIKMTKSFWIDLFLTAFGLTALIYGGHLFLASAISIAAAFGISDAIIGLSLIALGTSLPELATCVVAAFRGHQDIALGNAIGSNIFNIFGIAGVASYLNPIKVELILPIDLIVLLLFTMVIIFQMYTKKELSRVEGGILLVGYFSYIAYLFTL